MSNAKSAKVKSVPVHKDISTTAAATTTGTASQSQSKKRKSVEQKQDKKGSNNVTHVLYTVFVYGDGDEPTSQWLVPVSEVTPKLLEGIRHLNSINTDKECTGTCDEDHTDMDGASLVFPKHTQLKWGQPFNVMENATIRTELVTVHWS